jgi:hypothetical protein
MNSFDIKTCDFIKLKNDIAMLGWLLLVVIAAILAIFPATISP